MTAVQRSVVDLVAALYVLVWLAAVGVPDAVEHVEEEDGDGVFAGLRRTSGGRAS